MYFKKFLVTNILYSSVLMFFVQVQALDYLDDNALWAKALVLYGQQDYEAARTTAERITAKGYGVWRLIAECWCYSKQYEEAYRALKHAEKQCSLWQYFELKQAFTCVNKHRETHATFFTPGVLAHVVSPCVTQGIFLVSWWGVLYTVFRKRTRRIQMGILVVTMLIALFFMHWHYQWYSTVHGIVQKSELLYIGPDVRYATLGQLQQGEEIIVLAVKEGWYKIKRGIHEGWVIQQIIDIL